MELIDGLQKHKKLQELFEKVERRINEGDPEDAAVNMRKMLEYFTSQYVKEFAQQLVKNDLFTTINGLQDAGVIPKETASLFHKIRMMANKGAAHLSNEKIPITEVKDFYNQLLTFVPSFLSELPEPSKKKVKDNPFDIDYMSITPLWIELTNYEKNLEYDEWFNIESWQYWETFDEYRDLYDSLEWLRDPERYIYTERKRSYVNRLQLVIDIEDEIKSLITSGECNRIWDNSIYVPGIIQQYFGFSRVIVTEEEEKIKGPNGMTATRRGKLKKKVTYCPINPARIIPELAAFRKTVAIPECIKVIEGIPYMDTYSNTKFLIIPATMSVDQNFQWLRFFSRCRISIHSECDFFIQNEVVYTKDKKKILCATKQVDVNFQVPDEVEIIGESAFECNNIESISLNNVKKICDYAFNSCKKLKVVTDISQLEYIGERAFIGCKALDATVFVDKNIKIERNTFEGCIIPKMVKSTNQQTNHSEIDLSYSIENICYDTSQGNIIDNKEIESIVSTHKITELIFPKGVTYIHYCGGCIPSLRKVTFPNTLTSIGPSVFKDDDLREVFIPDGVRSIGKASFMGNLRLKKVRIPDTIKEIYESSFDNCPGLEEVEVPDRFRYIFKDYPDIKFSTPVSPSENFLRELDKQYILYQDRMVFKQTCSKEMIERFENYDKSQTKQSGESSQLSIADYDKLPGKSYVLKVTLDETGEKVPDFADIDIDGNMVTELIIPNSLIHCSKAIFVVFPRLRKISFPKTLISIGDMCFFRCLFLQEVYIPDGVKSIGMSAFQENRQLKRLRIPDTVEKIDKSAFWDCTNLEEVDVPERYQHLFKYYPNVKFTTIKPPKNEGRGLSFFQKLKRAFT